MLDYAEVGKALYAPGVAQAPQPSPAKLHDEAMRMQALAIGARLATEVKEDGTVDYRVRDWAQWAYREATGREW